MRSMRMSRENVTPTYSWNLPETKSYAIKSRATIASGNIETPGSGNTVTVNMTGPSGSTVPENETTGVALNSDVTVNFSETWTTTSTVTISPAVGDAQQLFQAARQCSDQAAWPSLQPIISR